jgi:hypothetical protein
MGGERAGALGKDVVRALVPGRTLASRFDHPAKRVLTNAVV